MKAVIIVAGGSGQRMNAHIPKQFLELNHRPILMHTIEAFYRFDNAIKIVLVLPESQINFWKELCVKYNFEPSHTIQVGGESRFASVKKGLRHIPNNCTVAVHDGVRPLVSQSTIKRCFEMAEQCGSAVPVIESVNSIREITDWGSESKDRNKYKIVQTPQVFAASLLHKAYLQPFTEFFTDDASVVEMMGEKISLTKGNEENIKITTATDLAIAHVLIELQSE